MKPWATTKIFIIFFISLGCSARKAKYENDVSFDNFTYDLPDEAPTNPSLIKWGLSISLMQLVTETVSEEICPSGWTELYKRFKSEGKAELVPLQPDYVKRFADLNEFDQAMDYAFPLVSKSFPVIRLTLVWPCFQDSTWQEKILQTVKHLQELGAEIELTLSHHDSYPASLETTNIMTTGWANENATTEFADYSANVISLFEGKIPKGTVIYLINEPMGYLFNAYLGLGNWPPGGGKKAAKTMVKALINMREGLYLAAKKLKKAGYKVAIAKNIRPVLNNQSQSAKTLNYIFNWWLLEALFHGCIDNNFNEKCEERREPAPVEILGITFYGTMQASNEIVEFGLPGEVGVNMALPEYDFTPNYVYFEESLEAVTGYFSNIEIGVAEIGFSAVSVEKMAYWLISYKNVVETYYQKGEIKNVPFVQLHSLFEYAEFSPREWVFHLIGICGEEGCGLTEWGKTAVDIVLGKI